MKPRYRFSKRIAIALLAGTALIASSAQAASYKVIVNNSVSINSLSKKAASDLFLKKTTKWESGSSVTPVDQLDSSNTREGFSKAVHGKTAAAVKSYWNQQIFSGRDVPPVEKKSDAEVLSFVRNTPGAIGYVSDGASVEGVRVVTIN
jgi:ABC-type phosphate transport system substrate-binding protein